MTFRFATDVTTGRRGIFELGKLPQFWVNPRYEESETSQKVTPRRTESRVPKRHDRCQGNSGAVEEWRTSLISWEDKEIMKTAYLKRAGVAIFLVTILTFVFLVSGAAQTDVKFTDAASYYKDAKCVVCHGQKAEKKFNADLKDEEMVEIVLKGKKPEKPPNMPGYEAKGVTAEQAKAMVDYMRSLKQ